jgi:alkylation response protein AidB-like acyl-CoA dehydrogenase
MMHTRSESLLEALHAVEPVIREHAVRSEQETIFAARVVEAFCEQGLYGVYRPEAWGGLESHPLDGITLFEEAARIDGSAGWNLMNNASVDFIGALLPERGAREIFGDPKCVVASAANPPGRAVPVDGGYRVTSRVPFMTGCSEAAWFITAALIVEADGPRTAPDGTPMLLLTGYPRGEARIVLNWETLGMRGTGSHDVVVEELFVPEHRTATLASREPSSSAYDGPLYRMGLWGTLVPSIASVSLGVARTAIDVVRELARAKVPAYVSGKLADRGVVHRDLARAEAKYRAARALLHQAVGDAFLRAEEGTPLGMDDKLSVQLACTHANVCAAEVVDLVYALAGATAIRKDFPLERCFRDAHTLTQHAFVGAPRFESCGRLMLGVESDWSFFDL